MSLNLQKLCCKILEEYFGRIVAKVGEVLFKHGTIPLRYICDQARLPRQKVKQTIAVLIQHNLVVWEEWKPRIPAYTLLDDRILLILRYPRYVFLMREQYGEEAEMVVDVLLKEGQATASHIIIMSCLKLHDASDEGKAVSGRAEDRHVLVYKKLLLLIEGGFIQRCPFPIDDKIPVPVLNVTAEQLYSLPPDVIDLKGIHKEIQLRVAAGNVNSSHSLPSFPDANMFWRLNYDQFHLEFRDTEVRNSIVRRVDPLAGECFRAVLKVSYSRSDPWAPCLNEVRAAEIRDHLKDLKHLDQYLKTLEEESGGCLQRVGDGGGGQYRANMAAAYQTLGQCVIDNIVQERFGSKAARIFRLVRNHQMMEQDQIGELSMVGKKEANQITYQLLNDNFFHIHEVRKSIAPSPANKTIYLFHVDMNAVVRMMLEWCYKALYNLMVQRDMRHTENQRLLEKKARVDTIIDNLKQSEGTEEQIQEVEEMVTPSEREVVEEILSLQDKLFDTEIGLDETVFLLQMYLYYHPKSD